MCSNLRLRSASLDRDAAGEVCATCHCLARAQPVSSVARVSDPIIPLAQCAYGGLWSILGEWDPRTYTFVFAQLAKNIENACIKTRKYKLATQRVVIFLRTHEFRDFGLEVQL